MEVDAIRNRMDRVAKLPRGMLVVVSTSFFKVLLREESNPGFRSIDIGFIFWRLSYQIYAPRTMSTLVRQKLLCNNGSRNYSIHLILSFSLLNIVGLATWTVIIHMSTSIV